VLSRAVRRNQRHCIKSHIIDLTNSTMHAALLTPLTAAHPAVGHRPPPNSAAAT
jgi:hypothetical protein